MIDTEPKPVAAVADPVPGALQRGLVHALLLLER